MNMDWFSLVISVGAMLTAIGLSYGVVQRTVALHEKTLEKIECKIEEMVSKSLCLQIRSACSTELKCNQEEMHCMLSKNSDILSQLYNKLARIEAQMEPVWEDWKKR